MHLNAVRPISIDGKNFSLGHNIPVAFLFMSWDIVMPILVDGARIHEMFMQMVNIFCRKFSHSGNSRITKNRLTEDISLFCTRNGNIINQANIMAVSK